MSMSHTQYARSLGIQPSVIVELIEDDSLELFAVERKHAATYHLEHPLPAEATARIGSPSTAARPVPPEQVDGPRGRSRPGSPRPQPDGPARPGRPQDEPGVVGTSCTTSPTSE